MTFVFKHPILAGVLSIAFVALVGYSLFSDREARLTHESVVVGKSELTQMVSVTGRVEPARRVDLAFDKTGRVARVDAEVGDRVFVGQVLVLLDSSETKALHAEAMARLRAAEARLAELLRGTRSEEIRVQETKVANAKTALADARRALVETLKDGYTKTDDAIRNKVDQFFTNPRSGNPQLTFNVADAQLEIKLESARPQIESLLVAWQVSLDMLSVESELATAVEKAGENLAAINEFLNDISFAVNDLRESAGFNQTTIDGYKTGVSTARTNVNTAISDLSSADEKRQNKISDLALAEEELVLKKAGATPEELAVAEADIEEALATVARYAAELERSVISAPINGVITDVSVEAGETVAANNAVVSLISATALEIKANVPEIDIVKLEVGDYVRVTLDAYGKDAVFEARVTAIDPAETIVEGVPTYSTTLQFTEPDRRIKSGMTANIDIVTDTRDDVFTVPARAVFEKDGGRMVRIIASDGTVREAPVVVGLRGSDGRVEITEGLSGGERVITLFRE